MALIPSPPVSGIHIGSASPRRCSPIRLPVTLLPWHRRPGLVLTCLTGGAADERIPGAGSAHHQPRAAFRGQAGQDCGGQYPVDQGDPALGLEHRIAESGPARTTTPITFQPSIANSGAKPAGA